jgi:hypothetical protein
MPAEHGKRIVVGAECEGVERLLLCRSNTEAHHAIVQWRQ